MRWKQPNWTRILTILLVILASIAVLYILGAFAHRFAQAIFLFILGAITAYILSPLVNSLQRLVRLRWLAILLSYLMIAAALLSLGVLMVTPFVQQAQSLVDNLHTPQPGSLKTIRNVEVDLATLQQDLNAVDRAAVINIFQSGQLQNALDTVRADLTRLQQADIADLSKGTLAATSRTPAQCRPLGPGKITSCPTPQTQVPPSYVKAVTTQVDQLAADWSAVNPSGTAIDQSALKRMQDDIKRAQTQVEKVRHTASTTPILLLRSQSWLDQHGLHIDLPSRLGDAAAQLSNQGTNLLNNAITIVSETLNILLNITLILIISFYLLLDGQRLIHGGLIVVPAGYRDQVWYFVQSIDKVMGGYLRGQIFLSLLSGILGGGGAAVLGVPYPLLIGIVTGLLQAVPVIGPIVAVFPAVIVSLFFMPLLTTAILFAWFLIFQQVVSNVLGPRIMGMAVGIHPLEALFAVLVGYPLGGFLGAFLAVPTMGIIHILIRQTYAYFVLGQAMPAATVPEEVEELATTVAAPAAAVAPTARTEPGVRPGA